MIAFAYALAFFREMIETIIFKFIAQETVMRVKSLGFSIENRNKNIKSSDVMNEFIKASGREHSHADATRRILVSDSNDFYYGLVVTFRNQKKNCKSQFSDGKFKLKIDDLKGDEKLVSFNFFAIKKSNLTGLYMYHHGSCSLTGVFTHLQTISNEFIRNKNSEEIKSLGENPKKKDIISINKKYRERVSFSLMTNKSDISQILSNFRKIKKSTFKFDYIDFNGGPMTALESFTKTTTIDMTFDDDSKTKISALSETMSDIFKKAKGISKARVVAIDYSNIEKTIDFMNCPTFFESYDFDLIAEKVDGLTDDNYTSNPIFDIITEEILNGANKHVFI